MRNLFLVLFAMGCAPTPPIPDPNCQRINDQVGDCFGLRVWACYSVSQDEGWFRVSDGEMFYCWTPDDCSIASDNLYYYCN